MNGGKDCKGGVSEGAVHTAPVQVPIGWQRKVDPTNGVLYISPSGSVLSCLDQVKSYLLTDGTCKCGLECPLILPKVFNFDPGASVKQRTAEDVRADEDVTKLCIHKRKLLAVTTLHKSMALPHPSLTLTSPGGGTSSTSMVPSHSTNPRAIRNKSHESLLPNSVVPNCKNPFKMMMTAAAGQRHFPQELGGPPQQQELYPGYPNRQQRLNSEPGPRSSYCSGYGSMLSPGGPGTQLYGPGDGSPLSPSVRSDPLGSPDGFRNNPCGFPGANSSSPIHGGNRTPLSPPGMLIHGSPAVAQTSVAQTSCAMSGRTSTPLSPTATAKSPVMMMKPVCNFPGPPSMDMPIQALFHHKTQSGAPYPGPRPPHPGPPSAIPSSCTLQKKQMTSEKDPLGILDPIPSKPSISISQTNSNFQPSVHSSQVPMMNVNMNNHPPPAIVPLPSNLPLPTVKPGPVGHNHGGHMQRTQQQTSITSSMSPSPVTSPVHMSGPVLGSRMEASPQRSRSSSTSSDHGSFAMPSGPSQGPCGGMKAPPRSPRPTMPINMPSSPSSTRPDSHTLHQYKDLPSQLLVGMSNQNAINTQHNNPGMYPPATSSGPSITASHQAQNQKGQNHPGLLGMPLNQILNQQNAASFPASSLLSAAAKAQLANQNKHGDNSSETGSRGSGMGGGGPGRVDGNGGSSGVGHPTGPLSGTRSGIEGHSSSTLNPMLPPNSPMLMPSIAEAGGQSGRAALRDKLMAQQRDRGDPLLRKRKQQPPGPPPPNNTLNHHDSMVFNMLNKPPNTGGGPGPRLPPSSEEQLRKVARLGGLPPNTSMAQLLQSMSNHNNHQNQHQGPAGPTGPGQMHYSDGAGVMPPGASQQQNLLAQQRMLGQGEGQGMYCQSMDSGGPHSHGPRFPGLMNQIQANSLVNCGPLGSGGQVGLGPGNMPLSHHPNTNPPPLSHPSHPSQHPHQQQHSHLHAALGRTSMSGMALGNSDGSCGQAISEPGDPSNIVNCSMGLQPHVINSSSSGGTQVFQQHHAQPQLHQSIQRAMQGLPPGYQGSQQPGFSENNPFPDNNSSNSHPMACLFQNFQWCLPDNSISVPHSQMISQSGMTSLPKSRGMLSHPQFSVSQREMQQMQGEGLPPGMHGSDRLPSGGVESVDAIYRAVVDAASKGMHVVITTTVSGTTQSSPVPTLSTMSAFTNSVGEPVSINHNLPHSHAAVSHSVHRVAHQEGEQTTTLSQQPRPRQVRAGRPRKNSGHGKSNVSIPEGHGALPEAPHQDYFRSPGRGTPRGQWEGETGLPGSLDGGHTAWAGEDFLECSTHGRSSPCMERPGSLAPAPPCPADSGPHEGHHSLPIPSDKAFLEDGFSRFNTCNRTAVNIINYKERLDQTVERCAHMNGGGVGPPQVQFSLRGYGVSDPLGPPRQGDLTGDDQSPSSSTSLEGPLVKEYVGHYNGHFNGGCAPSPSDTKSLSSEEDLRHPDSPSSEMLHYRPRTFNMGDLVWGQGFKGFPSWPGKLAGEEAGHNHHHHASLQLREESKVEPEKLKTLTHDLEALDRATKRNRKAGKLNNHLEAAIHEAMSELDKMSGTVHQIPSRDRQVKLPKPKRRKISR